MKKRNSVQRLAVLLFILSIAFSFGSAAFGADDTSGDSVARIRSGPDTTGGAGEDLYWQTYPFYVPYNSKVTGVENIAFGGRSFVFVATGCDMTAGQNILRYYWYTEDKAHPESCEREILHTQGARAPDDYSFKPVVFHDQLYIFYATEKSADPVMGLEDGTIYVQSASKSSHPQPLSFGAREVVYKGIENHRRICAAQVMNGKLYLIYAVCTNPDAPKPYQYKFYALEKAYGGDWIGPTLLTLDGVDTFETFPQTATTFIVTDAEKRNSERMALGFVDFTDPGKGAPWLAFFDGTATLYGKKPIPNSYTQNILLATGTVKGATNDKQAVQIWVTDASPGEYRPIYHNEYWPSGVNGNEGSFRKEDGVWTLVPQPTTWERPCPEPGWDHWGSRFWTADRWLLAWSAGKVSAPLPIETGQKESKGLQQNLDLTYFQRWVYYFPIGSRPRMKTLRYASDVLQKTKDPVVVDSDVAPGNPNYETLRKTWILQGVIEGPPPFPHNGNYLNNLGAAASRVSLGKSEGRQFVQTYNTSRSYQMGLQGGFALTFSFELGQELAEENQQTEEINASWAKTATIDTTTGAGSADVGKLVFVKPKFENQQYKLFGADGGADLNLIVDRLTITGATLDWEPYSLTNPDSSPLSTGMTPRWQTIDYVGWATNLPKENSPAYQLWKPNTKLDAGRGSSVNTVQLVKGKSFTDTRSSSLTCNSGGGLGDPFYELLQLDFDSSSSSSFAMTSTTTLSETLEWFLDLPVNQLGDKGLNRIKVWPYFLQAKDYSSTDAWWIPSLSRANRSQPWCITYNVAQTDPFPPPPVTAPPTPHAAASGDSSAAPTTAYLTLAAPTAGGWIDSSYLESLYPENMPVATIGSFEATKDDAIDLSAQSEPGYVFEGWSFEGGAVLQHGPANAPITWVVLRKAGGHATVSSRFRKILPDITLSIDDSRPADNFIRISGASLGRDLLNYDPESGDWLLVINGYKLPCNDANGTWTRNGATYSYATLSGKTLLSLDFDEMSWSFASSDSDICLSLPETGNSDVTFGFQIGQSSYVDKAAADVKYSFKATQVSGAGSSNETPTAGTPDDSQGFSNLFSVSEMKGSFNGTQPARNVITAKGDSIDLRNLNPAKFSANGIVAFYAGDDLLFEAKASDLAQKGSVYSGRTSSGNRVSTLQLDTKSGRWSLKMTGSGAQIMPKNIVGAYLVIYDVSPEGPEIDAGLGYKGYKIMWAGAEELKLNYKATMKRTGK